MGIRITGIRRSRSRRMAGALSVSVLMLLAGTACVPPGPESSGTQEVCATDVSITQVDVTIVSAPDGANIHMEIYGVFFDGSESGVSTYPPVPGPLVAGQTYTLPPGQNLLGYVDLGRCLDVVASPGLVYRITAVPVVNPAVALLYWVEPAHPGHLGLGNSWWRGRLAPVPPSGPVRVAGLDGATGVAAGRSHSCAVVSGGGVKCWGFNGYGDLGDGTKTNRTAPVDVAGITTATQVVAGDDFACALLANGTVKCWGRNSFGELGNGTSNGEDGNPLPVDVVGLGTATRLDAFGAHACAVLSDGSVQCWGADPSGVLGNGQTGYYGNSSVPVTVLGISGATAVATGGSHSCAISTPGATAKCWGGNGSGQLGDGSLTDSLTPVDVSGLSGVAEIEAGAAHTCAILTTGIVKCWGGNGGGTLGDGTTTDRSTPVDVVGLADVAQVAAGRHTCAVTVAGGVQCWGVNESGQLGDSTRISRNVPTVVPGVTGASRVAAGGSHSCALVAGGGVECWGNNLFGQLGTGG